ncbi:hypothetical protein RHGRI_011818 [Rhododendron griersonianum]|uniref:Uncharacterized protein n=1 Tax=Rhododendron griersonianum TaxID=479676 RepID=A0AAV6KNS9_9ERIC|nr:hypothetical protein RHGRI_011818 [Rhododendron griersonianum]
MIIFLTLACCITQHPQPHQFQYFPSLHLPHPSQVSLANIIKDSPFKNIPTSLAYILCSPYIRHVITNASIPQCSKGQQRRAHEE